MGDRAHGQRARGGRHQSAAEVGDEAITGAGVVYEGMKTLGEGAILAGLVLGAIVAFIIDRRFWQAAAFCALRRRRCPSSG